MRAPASGCSRMSAHSSSSSGSALSSRLDGQRELADVVDERAQLDRRGGVGVGPELQRDVARVEGDRRRVLGRLGIEGRERAHERDAGREGGAVDGAGRAAAAPGGAEESAHAMWLEGGRRRTREGRARRRPPVYDVPGANPCETADGRCKHRPSASVLRAGSILPADMPVCVHMTLLPVPGTASEVARETILGPSTGRLYRMGTQSASSPNLPRTSHSGSAIALPAPMRYGPQIRGKARAAESEPPSDAPREPRRRRTAMSRGLHVGPADFRSFHEQSGGNVPRPTRGSSGRRAPRKTQKGRPRRAALPSRSRRASGRAAASGPTPPRPAPRRRSRSRRRARRSAPPTRSRR